MIYRTYIPQSPLSEFVDSFWYCEGSDRLQPRESHLPIGIVELVFNLDPGPGPNGHGAVCRGPFSEPSLLETAPQSSLMGAHFKPTGARSFFKLPLNELHNMQISLADLWGADADHICEQLLTARTVEAGFRLLEEVLLIRLMMPLRPHPAVVFAARKFRKAPHECTISQILNQTGLSQRHLARLFSREIGLKPKLFIRLQRFHQALRRAEGRSQVDWAQFALDCGYFDQSHFIHDFRSFSGLTPSTWLKNRGDSLIHLPTDR